MKVKGNIESNNNNVRMTSLNARDKNNIYIFFFIYFTKDSFNLNAHFFQI